MKAVILAGGKGTRLSEYTKLIPKPMVEINKKPIIVYIIDHFYKYGIREILIASGYKHNIISNFFKKNKIYKDLEIKVINTGLNSLTGKRIMKLKNNFSKNEDFFLTYGDGISNVDLRRLLNFHKKHKKIATLTAVHPPARFGELKVNKNKLIKFDEKPQTHERLD